MEFESSRSDTFFSFAAGFACGKLYLLRKYRDAHPLRGKSVSYGGWGASGPGGGLGSGRPTTASGAGGGPLLRALRALLLPLAGEVF